ncbi:hypothetical protein PISL3812_03918 [Talaromyces islandicus]|uniref:Zn(2)-C6 fungal-type domain-containing protein n=1 Tax=Talaromyces islandicus TaxID=28573 RepID=A0A0U1LUJ9_TALIS|nr:hypothetical protein PISL3812_03918 [Talaromyces islandicus]
MDDPLHRPLKTRKVRKGTRSCWECKRRKVRCSLSTSSDNAATCLACRRRRTPCVSQEFSQDYAPSAAVSPATPTVHSTEPSGLLSPISCSSAIKEPDLVHGVSISAGISKKLHDALPSRHDMEIIWQALSLWPLIIAQMDARSRDDVVIDEKHLRREFAQVPEQDAHPTTLGRYLIVLVLVLQEIRDTNRNFEISEPVPTVMNRIVGAVNTYLLSNECLSGTIEGIRCVLLEGIYHANNGNARLAWLRFRRALNLGQLLGIHRLGYSGDNSTQSLKSQYLWFRLVYFDSFYSMMLGVPQGCVDPSMRSKSPFAHLPGLTHLERTHVQVVIRIIERDTRFSFAEEFEITRDINKQLLQAARDLASEFWLPFSPDVTSNDNLSPDAECKEIMKLVDVLHHYTLVTQLHLPYILTPSSRNTSYEYSKSACIHATREILLRFTMILNVKRLKFYCKRIDYFVLIAATTLLLIYLDSHDQSKKTSHFILTEHQRLTDRTIIKQTLTFLENSSAEGYEQSYGKGLNLLLCLLSIEAEAASGQAFVISADMSQDHHHQQRKNAEDFDHQSNGNSKDSISVNLPYLGVVRITRQAGNHSQMANMSQLLYPSNNTNVSGEETVNTSGPLYDSHDLGTDTQLDWPSFQDLDLAFFDSLVTGGNMDVLATSEA